MWKPRRWVRVLVRRVYQLVGRVSVTGMSSTMPRGTEYVRLLA
jgi:hypothetical protein